MGLRADKKNLPNGSYCRLNTLTFQSLSLSLHIWGFALPDLLNIPNL